MTRRLWLIPMILLALFIIGGVLLWLSQNLVQRSEEIYTGYDETVGRNPFYLTDRWLTRLGLTVHSVRGLDELPNPLDAHATLIIAIPSYALSAADSQRLLDWVYAGGHLLISVQHPHEPGQGIDHLLDTLEIRSHRVEKPIIDPVAIAINPALPPLQVQFHADLRLNEAFWQSIRWGEGRATLLTDLSWFTNDRLAEYDHADFLWALLQQRQLFTSPAPLLPYPSEESPETINDGLPLLLWEGVGERGTSADSQDFPSGEIWLQYRMLTPSLAQLLWQHAWMLLAGLMLTLLAALWSYSRRLGPLQVPRPGEQRRLAEHLQASSRFLWRHGGGPMLLQAARHHALRQIERRQPGPSPDITLLTHSDQPLNERDLVQTLQTLQRLNRPQ